MQNKNNTTTQTVVWKQTNQRVPLHRVAYLFLALAAASLIWALMIANLQPVEARQLTETTGTDGIPAIWNFEVITDTLVGNRFFIDMTGRSLAYYTDQNHTVEQLHYAYGGNGLYYATSSYISPTWTTWTSELVDASLNVGRYASIAVTNSNQPYIAYYDEENGCLKVATRSGGAWWVTYPEQTSPVDLCDHTVLPVAPTSENLGIRLLEDGTTQVAEQIIPMNWVLASAEEEKEILGSPQAEPESGVGKWTSIAVDSNGNPHISYTKFYPREGQTYHKLKYAFASGGAWHIFQVTQSGGGGVQSLDEGLFTAIAIDSRDQPHIAFLDDTHDKVRYAFSRKAGESWNFSYPTNTGFNYDNLGGWNSLVLKPAEPDDTAYISYYDKTAGRLKIAKGVCNYYEEPTSTKCNYPNGWDLTSVDGTGDTGLYSSLAKIPGDNNLGVSYFNESNDDLKYATGLNSWSSQIVTGTNSGAGRYTSLVYDYKKKPHITYFDFTSGHLFEATITSTKWIFKDIDLNYNTGLASVLKFDSANKPYVLYYNDSLDALELAQKSPPWVAETITSTRLTTPSTSYPTSGFGLNQTTGKYHVSFYDSVNKNLVYATFDPFFNVWDYEILDETGDVGKNSSLALDSSGNPYISYYDATNGNLKLAYWDGVNWATETVDAGISNTGLYSSIAIDQVSGEIMISYNNATAGQVWLAYSLAGAPHVFTLTLVDTTGAADPFNSLAIDPGGRPHIAYYDVATLDLNYATAPSSGPPFVFATTSVDTIGYVGKYCSIATDHSGLPHISYYDETNGNLKYAYFDGTVWGNQTVDGSTDDVGLWTSIAIENAPSNIPHISYYNRTKGKLQYTYDPPIDVTSIVYFPFILMP